LRAKAPSLSTIFLLQGIPTAMLIKVSRVLERHRPMLADALPRTGLQNPGRDRAGLSFAVRVDAPGPGTAERIPGAALNHVRPEAVIDAVPFVAEEFMAIGRFEPPRLVEPALQRRRRHRLRGVEHEQRQ